MPLFLAASISDPARRGAEHLLGNAQVGEALLHQPLAVAVVVDDEVRGEAERLDLAPQDAHAGGVEGRHPRAARSPPSRRSRRSRISAAALLVNVTARMRHGSTPRSPMRCATRCVSVRVLPDPAPARISSGPSPCSTACCCIGLRDERRSAIRHHPSVVRGGLACSTGGALGKPPTQMAGEVPGLSRTGSADGTSEAASCGYQPPTLPAHAGSG